MNNYRRRIMLVDFESVGADPETCDPVQLSALVVDPYKLEIIDGSEFDIKIRPDTIDKDDYLELNMDSINWHAKLRNKSQQEVVEEWKKGIDTKTAIKSFVSYVEKWNPKKNSFYTATNFAGANPQFDLTILKRYCKEYGINSKNLFYWRDTIDVIFLAWMWLQWQNNPPTDYKMDTLRKYFGLSLDNAHDALQDVRDEAKILIRFLNFHKRISEKTIFADCFKN